MAEHDLLAIGDRIAGWARDGEQVEAVVVSEQETEVRVYEGEIESYTAAASAGVGVRVIRDSRQGFAYAGSLDADVLEDTLAEARDNAGFGTVDEALGLASPDGVEVADLQLFNPALAEFPNDSKIDLAIELEQTVRAGDPRIKGVESAEYVDVIAEGAVVTNTGIRTSGRDSASYIAAYALAEENGETQSGFGFSVGRDPHALDVSRAAADAVDRATRLLGASKPPSERVTVVLDPWVTAQFLAIVGSTLSGEAVLKGRSLFAGRLEDEVAASALTLVDDPTNPAAFSATESDGEGLATRRNVLIDGGVLRRFLHNSYTARRCEAKSTGSAVRGYASTPGVGCMAVSLLPGERSQEELIAMVGEGILIQGVSGLHSGVNPVSGDFSTGAEGLRISGGALGEPVREFTIASTIQRMLLDAEAVGNDLEWLPMAAAGVSLVVRDVTVSGD